jgi:cold-inducible RNA-binding protein
MSNNSKLFVGNLSFNTTENDLRDAFGAHGTVAEVNLMMDRESGRPRGFGFVTMSTSEEAQAAISALNGKNVDGRDLTVNEAKPREERSGGGFGGRSSGGSKEYSGGRNSRSRY